MLYEVITMFLSSMPMLPPFAGKYLTVQSSARITSYNVCYTKLLRLEIFLVILAAGSVAGILGMILAIPTYTILRVIAKEFLDNLKIVKKLTQNLDQ